MRTPSSVGMKSIDDQGSVFLARGYSRHVPRSSIGSRMTSPGKEVHMNNKPNCCSYRRWRRKLKRTLVTIWFLVRVGILLDRLYSSIFDLRLTV